MPAAPTTVKDLCTLIVRSQLMTADEVKGVLRHHQEQRPDGDDLEGFRKRLVANKYLTEYQAALLGRGHSEGFFLDKYKIMDRIAKGRMAGVYRAIHSSGQSVAIKVLPTSKAKDAETLARFRREARLLTRLDHPNVVRAFEVGEAAGRYYLAMEYLDGDTLEDVLEKRKRLPAVEAVRIVHQALEGLQHIYERGMIHRDLKPSNIILLDAGYGKKEEDTLDRAVKILDIGFGKSIFEEGVKSHVEDPSQLTGDGVLLGTPDYLAPEQARNASAADIRSDIYSLGCVLYHALTGQPPFPDKSVLNQVMRHAIEAPRPLSDFLDPVPEGLESVLAVLMAKDPPRRFDTPEKAAHALKLFLRSTPEPARPAGVVPAYQKWLQDSAEMEVSAPPAPAVPRSVPLSVPFGRLEPPRGPDGRRPAAPTLMAAGPAPGTPVAAAVSSTDFDVELIDALPTRNPTWASDRPRGLWELNRRDVLMLGTGGGLVTAAIAAGWGLSRLLRRHDLESEPAPPKE